MKQQFLYLISTISVCCWMACNSDDTIGLPDSGTETPIFSVKALERSSNIQHFKQAGLENYYLFTYQENDSYGVANTVASLRQEDCDNNCPESFELRITNFTRAGAPASDLLKEGRYLIRNTQNNAELCQVQVSNESDGPIDSFFWLFGDSASVSNQPNAINNYIVEDGLEYFVRLVSTDEDGRAHSLAKRSSPQNFANQCPNPIQLVSSSADSLWLTLSPDSKMDADYYVWAAGDSIYTSDTFVVRQGEEFSFIYESNTGCALDYNGYAEIGSGQLRPFLEFSSSVDCIAQGSRYQLSRIEMIYTDENGKAYSSAQYNNRGNFVTISELKPYVPNERGVQTYSATVEIREIGLQAADGSTKVFENVLAKVAFAQP